MKKFLMLGIAAFIFSSSSAFAADWSLGNTQDENQQESSQEMLLSSNQSMSKGTHHKGHKKGKKHKCACGKKCECAKSDHHHGHHDHDRGHDHGSSEQ
jgi:hypothetical protein